MSPELIEKYFKAGSTVAEVRRRVKNIVKEGMLIIDLCEEVESLIRRMGCKPAFPCNVCVNDLAAHYTSPPKDLSRIPPSSMVKIDFGAHVDGCIADTAITISFSKDNDRMVQAVEEALEKALKIVKLEARITELSFTIESTIKRYGFKPISNLCGHTISPYTIHGGISIPNIASFTSAKFKANNVYAIEPFATTMDAAGEVVDGGKFYIYRKAKPKPPKEKYAKELFKIIESNYRTLPFAKRWLADKMPTEVLDKAFNTLLELRFIEPYPVLVEKTRKPVAQAEHTVLIEANGQVHILSI